MREPRQKTLPAELEDAVLAESRRLAIPADLIRAIIIVESDGDPKAMRYEPGYAYLWNCRIGLPTRNPNEALPPSRLGSTQATERIGQKTSWGPMQVMGAVAREFGFDHWFPHLCGAYGIHFGTRYLAKLRDKWLKQHGWEGVVAAYNAGSPMLLGPRGDNPRRFRNQPYLDKVAWSGFDFSQSG